MSRCPAERQLQKFLDERLELAEARNISAHIATCERCQAVLERLTEDDSLSESVPRFSAAAGSTSADPSSVAFLARLRQAPLMATGDPASAFRSGTAPEIPGYEIVREVGRGGMGVVYQARHLDLNRLVALKMIRASQISSRELARFRQEAEAVARLHHPNIVQVFDIGEVAGRPYLALEYVDGGSLVQRLHGDPQPVYLAARLVETLALAVHFAHENGVIHRDLKPANILLTSGERKAESREPNMVRLSALDSLLSAPKVADFGLAKRLDEQASGTETGDVVGTPSYMAPEQARGSTHPTGPATDVYSLGAILYEMLTGRPPFKGPTPLDTVLQVLHEEPVRPSRLRPKVPRDLETICLKCLEKEPNRRYASARDLADDLRRFRHGSPILARPVGLRERAWKWARRRPVQAGLLFGLVLVTVLGFGGVTWHWRMALAEKLEKEHQTEQAVQARMDAERARQEEATQRLHARNALYYSRIAQSQLQWRVNDFLSAQRSLAQCIPPAGEIDRRGWEWYYLRGLFYTGLFTLRHRTEGVSGSVAVSADGRWIASVLGGHTPEEQDRIGELRIWDARTGETLHAWTVAATFNRLAFHPTSSQIALGGTDGTIAVWEAESGRPVRRHRPHSDAVAGIAFSPDGKYLASAGWDQVVKVHENATGTLVCTLQGHEGWVHTLAFHPDGRRLASAGQDATIRIWDIQKDKGEELDIFRGHKTAVYGVAFSPDGELLVSAGSNGNLKVWDLATRRVVHNLTGQAGAVLSVAFGPDGRSLAYGGGDTTVRVWDIESGMERIIFRGHTAAVDGVQFMPHGQRLVSVSAGQAAAKVWDLTRHPEYATLARTDRDIDALAFREDGRKFVSVTVTGKLQIWNAGSGVLQEERQLPWNAEVLTPAVSSTFSPDGNRLAGRSRPNSRLIQIWDVADGSERIALHGHRFPIRCLRYSGDGRHLASGACDANSPDRPHEVKVWDGFSGAELAGLTGTGGLFNLAFSPDGQCLALAGEDGSLSVIDWASQRTLFGAAAHRGGVAGLAFSPDGKLLASSGIQDRMVKVWEWAGSSPSAERKPVHVLAAPRFLGDLTFSPDGRRLAGASRDLVKIWDAETGQDVLNLRGAPQRHFDPAFNPRLLFSADGHRLVASNWDESISVWYAVPKAGLAHLERRQVARRHAADERAAFWHLQEAEHCLEHKNLPAARFHFKHLADADLPEPLQARRERIALQLANQP